MINILRKISLLQSNVIRIIAGINQYWNNSIKCKIWKHKHETKKQICHKLLDASYPQSSASRDTWRLFYMQIVPDNVNHYLHLVAYPTWWKIGIKHCGLKFEFKILISYTLGREYRVMRNRYLPLLFTSEDRLAPICACENNRRIWRHNASISRSRDFTDPLWWRHNAKSETTVPGDNCKMSDRWLFLAELCVQDIKQRVRNKIIHPLPIFVSRVMRFANDFHSWLRHSWKSLANRLTRDTKIVIHGNSCIILYIYITRDSIQSSW